MFKFAPQQNSPIKIVDFGFARYVSNEEVINTPCGTPGYIGKLAVHAYTHDKHPKSQNRKARMGKQLVRRFFLTMLIDRYLEYWCHLVHYVSWLSSLLFK